MNLIPICCILPPSEHSNVYFPADKAGVFILICVLLPEPEKYNHLQLTNIYRGIVSTYIMIIKHQHNK